MIDKKTGLIYVVKRPSPEKRYYGFDFSRLLTTIESIHSIVISPSVNAKDLNYLDVQFNGSVVDLYLVEGINGVTYTVDISVQDTDGNVIEERALVKVDI
jgi:hypothetical protein